MAVTIRDVAKIAGTSITTVSRVMNSTGYVSENTRVRVIQAIKELGYNPDVLARGLIKRSLKTVGVLIPDMHNLFFHAVLMGLEDELEKEGYGVFLCNTYRNSEKEKKYITTLLNRFVDGMIFVGAHPSEMTGDYIRSVNEKVPVVLINDYIIGSDFYSVMTDEVEGAYKATSYLMELGHTKVGFINGDTKYTNFRLKLRGYERALANRGIENDKRYVLTEMDDELGGAQGAKKFLSLEDPPTAILTASDQIALGAIQAILQAGHTIPDDFSLIGFANIPLSAYFYPALTTVDQFPYEMGKVAGETLVRAINKYESKQRKILIEPQIMVRNSCRKIETSIT